MIKNTKTVTINKFTFEYIPSMRVLNVTSPTGGIEVHHQLSYEKANEIVGEILEKNWEKKHQGNEKILMTPPLIPTKSPTNTKAQ